MRQLELQLHMPGSTPGGNSPGQETATEIQADTARRDGQGILTPRRRQVLTRYLRGETREEIAQGLGVSPNTVRNHIRLVYEELGLTNRVEALRWALEQPSMAPHLLRQQGEANPAISLSNGQQERQKPTSIEQMLDEAITFFRHSVVNSPLESA